MAAIPKLNVLLLAVLLSLLASIQQVMWSAMIMQWDNNNNFLDDSTSNAAWPSTELDDDDYTSAFHDSTANQHLIRQIHMRGGHETDDITIFHAKMPFLKKLRTSPNSAATTINNNNQQHHHHPPDPPPPTNIYILGERNSGTNYAASILKKAFAPPNNIIDDPSRSHEAFSSDIPILRHKHMFRHSLLNETELREIATRTDILWILVVRRPCDWAEAMKRMPWHMCNPTNVASDCPGDELIGFEHSKTLLRYSLVEFMQMEWGDWPESSNFRNLSIVSNDFIYRNIFELRRHKLQLMKQIVDIAPRNVKIVRLHELELSPELMIQVSIRYTLVNATLSLHS